MAINLQVASVTPKPIPPSIAMKWQTKAPLYGTLITTLDSTDAFFLSLDKRAVQYGRQPTNALVHPHNLDQRVSRVSFCLVYNAPNIDAVAAAGTDWTALDGLHVLVKNFSKRSRLWVNGDVLPVASSAQDAREEDDVCGRVYSGDVITVFQPHDGAPGECLRFVCDFFYGEARSARTEPFVKEPTKVRRQATEGLA
jgi:hypothetical protein